MTNPLFARILLIPTRLPLRAGRNTLVIHTTPKGQGTFLGIGAVLYDSEGQMLCE